MASVGRIGVTGIRVAWTTLPSEAAAKLLAEKVITENLAACAQVSGPITSFYHWEGKVQNDTEWRVTFKFPDMREETLARFVHANHPYTTPQWVSTEATGSEAYVAWTKDSAK